jgi:Tfp pilus assembly protein PilF
MTECLHAWQARDPRSTLPPQVIANVRLARGQVNEAIDGLTSALKSHPGDIGLRVTLGTAYSAGGKSAEAGPHLEAGLADPNTRLAALLGLGDLAARAGDDARALGRYREALALSPAHPVASNNIAWVLAEQERDLPEALRLARVAAADPEYTDAQDTLGWVLYKRRELGPAIVALKRARTLAPGRPDIATHLGLAYAKAGRGAAARTELNRALQAGGSSPSLRAQIEQALAGLPAAAK